jgi:hypothetical protein
MLKHLNAIRYVSPLREGGSLPAIVEADDNRLYVMKFRGAGQGRKALVAELLAGEIGRLLGLNIPEIVLLNLDPMMGRSEPDPEIQDLLKFSVGLNLGLAYLPSALTLTALPTTPIDATLASNIVWFDAYVTNVDRTPRNPNILLRNKEYWLIDHGAALYFHHAWLNPQKKSREPFTHIKDHILLPFATQLNAADKNLSARLNADKLNAIVASIPDEWLMGESNFETVQAVREAYSEYLINRLESPRAFVEEAVNARAKLV